MIEYKSQNCKLFQNLKKSEEKHRILYANAKFKYFLDFFNDMYFVRLMRNTFMLNVYDIIVGFPAPIILALLLNEITGKKFKNTVQTMIYMPKFISLIVLCGIVVDFCATEGVINDILSFLGFEANNLLQNPWLFKPIFVITNLWQYAGWNSILYMAAIMGINEELYDAAYVDGCGRFKRSICGVSQTVIKSVRFLKDGKTGAENED